MRTAYAGRGNIMWCIPFSFSFYISPTFSSNRLINRPSFRACVLLSVCIHTGWGRALFEGFYIRPSASAWSQSGTRNAICWHICQIVSLMQYGTISSCVEQMLCRLFSFRIIHHSVSQFSVTAVLQVEFQCGCQPLWPFLACSSGRHTLKGRPMLWPLPARH
jgi:hypothetical protein